MVQNFKNFSKVKSSFLKNLQDKIREQENHRMPPSRHQINFQKCTNQLNNNNNNNNNNK